MRICWNLKRGTAYNKSSVDIVRMGDQPAATAQVQLWFYKDQCFHIWNLMSYENQRKWFRQISAWNLCGEKQWSHVRRNEQGTMSPQPE